MMFRLADELGHRQVRGLGWSSGAFILIHMGVQQPERVDAMVLVGGTHRSSLQHREWVRSLPVEGWVGERREVLLHQHPGGDSQIRDIFCQFRKQADDDLDFDLSPEHLHLTQARTLVVLGDQDTQQTVENGVELFRAIPSANLWIVPGRGHDAGMLDDRHTFSSTVLRFLGDDWPS